MNEARCEMTFKIGDRVAYKAAWIKSTQCHDLASARGTVEKIEKLGQRSLVTVDWGDDDVPPRVIDANLCKVGSAAFGDIHAK